MNRRSIGRNAQRCPHPRADRYIAIAKRGHCTFVDKAFNAQEAAAAALVIVNDRDEDPVYMGVNVGAETVVSRKIGIPVVMVQKVGRCSAGTAEWGSCLSTVERGTKGA